MNEKELFQKKFFVKGDDFARAGEASIEMKNILKDVGYNPEVVRRVAIASYEAEMNMVMYGGDGEINFKVKPHFVRLVIEDHGRGILDIDLAMQKGYSTATEEMREMGFGAGMGLPNIKKNSDEFKIISEVGKGTRLEIIIKNK